MKAYKGFNRDMTCRGFQFEVDGETIKPDTWYILKGGKFVEVGDDNEK